ncbi:MAG: hypothetical protein ACYDBJ_25135 [Aggregatilineales bacterium]
MAKTNKWVYLFREGNADMRDLLGGKGAGVAEMTPYSQIISSNLKCRVFTDTIGIFVG